MSPAPTPVSLSVRRLSSTFGFPFCQRPKDLTKRRDDIVVADMEVHMADDMEGDKVADNEADRVANMAADKKNG